MNYEVKPNTCNCHPETCCCNPWKVVEKGTNLLIASLYFKDKAQQLADMLNRKNK